MESRPLLSLRVSVMAVFCVHLVIPQPQHKQLGLVAARGCAAPYQGSQYSVQNDVAGGTARAHHGTNRRHSTPLLQLGRAGRRAVLCQFSTASALLLKAN